MHALDEVDDRRSVLPPDLKGHLTGVFAGYGLQEIASGGSQNELVLKEMTFQPDLDESSGLNLDGLQILIPLAQKGILDFDNEKRVGQVDRATDFAKADIG